MHAKKVQLSHILIYPRNGVFCGWARLVGRGAGRVRSGLHQRVASECQVCERCFALVWVGVWKLRAPSRSPQMLLTCCEVNRENLNGLVCDAPFV